MQRDEHLLTDGYRGGRAGSRSGREAPFFPRWLVWLAVTLQLADLVSAARMIHDRGVPAEFNPIARIAYVRGGTSGLVALKGIMAVAATLGLLDARRENRRGYAQAVLVTAAAAGAFGCWSNLP